ncbi:hypothetical protein BX600DRAFT_102991 [Xylariales sp. PMI_506]|nr:hypothetical protein BX600DRAFT_102991 [Xylariales sp. PMI_506]
MTDPVELTFVLNDPTGLPPKRQQAARACEPCRKKKRRCVHGPNGIMRLRRGPRRAGTQDSTAVPPQPRVSSIETVQDDAEDIQDIQALPGAVQDQPSPQDESPRFVGDLNPEGILITAAMANKPKELHYRGHSDIGVWYNPSDTVVSSQTPRPNHPEQSESRDHRLTSDTQFTAVTENQPVQLDSPFRLRSIINTYTDNYIKAGASYLAPTPEDWRVLKDIYLTKIYPILPIFQRSSIPEIPKRLPRAGSPLSSKEILDYLIVGSICLASAADPAAAPFLRFSGSNPCDPVSYSEYGSSLVHFIRTASLRCEKSIGSHVQDYIRVLALTSFYWQPESSDRHEPSIMFAEVISLVHAYGLHVTDPGTSQGRRSKLNHEDSEKLFACIVAMDRINAALHGRAIMLADRDLQPNLLAWRTAPTTFEPGLRLLLLMILELDTVIDLYRPRPAVANVDIPVFEALVLQSNAENESQAILSTLEVLYHAISVLSVRMDHSCFIQPPETSDKITRDHRGELKYLPDSNLNARRSLSSDRILWIVQNHIVGPFPFVPYALSLSLSVAYRKWRFSRIPMFRARGKKTFDEVLQAIADLGMEFTSISRTQVLAQMVVTEMTKAEAKVKDRKHVPKPPATQPPSGVQQRMRTHPTQKPSMSGSFEADPRTSTSSYAKEISKNGISLPYTIINGANTDHDTIETAQSVPHNSHIHDGSQSTDPTTSTTGTTSGTTNSNQYFSLVEDFTQTPSLQLKGQTDPVGSGTEEPWNQSPVTARKLASDTTNSNDRMADVLHENLTPGSLPEDIFTIDLFPYIDAAFPQSEVDLAFSSNLDPSSGQQPWLNEWWESSLNSTG